MQNLPIHTGINSKKQKYSEHKIISGNFEVFLACQKQLWEISFIDHFPTNGYIFYSQILKCVTLSSIIYSY